MRVLDALFDPIQQISSNVEITGSLVQFAQFRQLMSESGHSRPNWTAGVLPGLAPLAAEERALNPSLATACSESRSSWHLA
jgi:hypothetical protein